MTKDDNQIDAEESRTRIRRMCESLSRFFVERRPMIELMAVSAVAREPLLLVGEPGTGKSDLVVKFCEALAVPRSQYFEYLLTQFTEPSELFGPIDLEQLRQGHHRRKMIGMLPTAQVVFLDEIFHANSAILNSMLTVLNERKVYDDGAPQDIAMKVMFAAANNLPDDPQMRALADRFPLKVCFRTVADAEIMTLIEVGIQNECAGLNASYPWAEGLCSMDDIDTAQRAIYNGFVERHDEFFPLAVRQEFLRWIRTLREEFRVHLSDRRVIRLYKMIRVYAWLFGGGVVRFDHLGLLQHAGDTVEELDLLAERVPMLLEAAHA
jgi:MoxR-like ATPase